MGSANAAVLPNEWNGLLLHRSGLDVARLAHGAEQLGAQPEVVEGHGVSC